MASCPQRPWEDQPQVQRRLPSKHKTLFLVAACSPCGHSALRAPRAAPGMARLGQRVKPEGGREEQTPPATTDAGVPAWTGGPASSPARNPAILPAMPSTELGPLPSHPSYTHSHSHTHHTTYTHTHTAYPPTHTHTTYSIHTHIQTHTHPAPRIFLHQAPHPLVLPAVAALPTAPQTPCALMVGGWGLGPKATSPPNTSGVSLTAPPTQGLAGLPAATRHTLEREEGSFPMSPAWDGQDSGQPGPGWEEQCEGRRRGRTGSPRTAPQSPSQAPHPAPWPWTSVSRSPRCPGTHSTHGSHVACSEGVLSARLALSCPRRRWQSFSCWQTGDRSVRPHGSAGHRSDSKLEGPVAASLNQRAHIPAGVLHQVTGRRHTGGCPRGLSAA